MSGFLEELFGVDLDLNDFEYLLASTSDLKLTKGANAVKNNITRALVTEPGELFWAPNYGVGLIGLINAPASADMFDKIRNRVKATLSSNPDVDEIKRVDVFEQGDGLYIVDIEYTLNGNPEQIKLSLRRTDS